MMRSGKVLLPDLVLEGDDRGRAKRAKRLQPRSGGADIGASIWGEEMPARVKLER